MRPDEFHNAIVYFVKMSRNFVVSSKCYEKKDPANNSIKIMK